VQLPEIVCSLEIWLSCAYFVGGSAVLKILFQISHKSANAAEYTNFMALSEFRIAQTSFLSNTF